MIYTISGIRFPAAPSTCKWSRSGSYGSRSTNRSLLLKKDSFSRNITISTILWTFSIFFGFNFFLFVVCFFLGAWESVSFAQWVYIEDGVLPMVALTMHTFPHMDIDVYIRLRGFRYMRALFCFGLRNCYQFLDHGSVRESVTVGLISSAEFDSENRRNRS